MAINNLYDYYTQNGGQYNAWNSSQRMGDAKKAGINNYTGSADQNNSLLKYLTSNSSATSTNPSLNTPAAQGYMNQQNSQGQQQSSSGSYGQSQGQNPATSPTAPSTANYDQAYKDYISSLAPNQGVQNSQKAYNDFIAQRDTTLRNTADQRIPMRFITGQQASIADRAGIEGNRLQGDVNIAQEGAQQLQSQSQARLGYEKSLLDEQNQRYQSDLDRTSKQAQFDKEYALKERELGQQGGFTLNEGDRRYDQNGKLIASGGAKTYAPQSGVDGLNSKQYTALNQVTTRFQADSIINQSIKGGTASAIADQIIANPGSATNQLKSLYVLVKNLDPDSAVREGELALANQTQSYMQQFGNTLARITEGRVVSPDAAIALANATKELMGAWNQTAQKRQQQYTSQASALGIGDEFNSYLQGSGLGYNESGNNQNNQSIDFNSPQWLSDYNYDRDVKFAQDAIKQGADKNQIRAILLKKYKEVNL